jgi:hypothetical protein
VSRASNNPQIVLHIDVFSADRTRKTRVIDQLVFVENGSWKIDDFRQATGEVLNGEMEVTLEADQCIGRKGRLRLKIDVYMGRTRNKVERYVVPENGEQEPPPETPPPGYVPKANRPF